MKKADRKMLLIYFLLAVLLFALISQIPYFSDDWVWGLDDRLSVFIDSFTNSENTWHFYNTGRYLGNGLGFIAANHVHIRNLIMVLTLCLTVRMLSAISSLTTKESITSPITVFLPAALLLYCPREFFRQTIAWTSAFMIYAVSAALYLLCLKKLFSKDPGSGSRDISFFILPFLASFFVENLTIGNALFISVWIFYGLLRKRKPSFNEWLYLAGSIAGLVLMFSDDGYHQIFAADQDKIYWSAQTGSIADMFMTGLNTYKATVIRFMFRENALLIAFGASQCFISALVPGRNSSRKERSIHAFIATADVLIAVYFLIRQMEPSWKVIFDATEIFDAAAAAFFILSIPVIESLLPVRRKQKEILIFSWVFCIFITAPLIVAEPLSERVFFPSYVFLLLIFCGITWHNIAALRSRLSGSAKKWICICMGGLLLSVWAYWFSIYAVIAHYDRERLKYMRYQESIGAYPAYIPRLPYEEYVIVSYPYEDLWQDRYKKFYGLNLDIKYELISFEDWKQRTAPGAE